MPSGEPKLRGRTALVTGGGRGIGRAIALGLAAEGATVAVVSRSEEEIDAVVAEAEAHGVAGLDILVSNVGGLIGAPEQLTALDHDDELFERNLFLNLTSAYYATRAALPRMVEG